MSAPEANDTQPTPRRHRDPALVAAAVIAVGLGLAIGAGSVFGGTGTTASVSDAVVPGIIGGIVGLVAGALVLATIRLVAVRGWSAVRPFAITALICTIGLGVLAGVSMAPSEPVTGAVVSVGANTAIPTGSIPAAGVVVPVDRDADGEPDTFEGQQILGFDIDDDDVADGFLRLCSREPDPLVEERPGYVAIDLRCDSEVDEYLPFDRDRILSVSEESVVEPESNDGIYADTLITIGLIIMLLALLVALGFFLSQVALHAPPIKREFVPLSTDLIPVPEGLLDADMVADLLQASLDGVLSGADPRVAIRVAYGTLLEGLAHIGLPRRPEEGPDEHMERCLRAADLPAEPIRELLRLFALARFSEHPITEGHRCQAILALDTALAAVGRLEVVR